MSVAHPFHRTDTSSSLLARRRRPSTTDTARTADPTGTTAAPVRRRTVHEPVVPGTRTPAGLPRELVLDESGKPRRSVLLAAIMIRRGRSVADISAATGLSADVVACLSRSL